MRVTTRALCRRPFANAFPPVSVPILFLLLATASGASGVGLDMPLIEAVRQGTRPPWARCWTKRPT